MHYKTKALVILLAGLFSLSSLGFHWFTVPFDLNNYMVGSNSPNNDQLNQEVEVPLKTQDPKEIPIVVVTPSDINNQESLSQSIIGKFTYAYLEAYDKAKEDWQKRQQAPLLKYIVKGNTESFWDGLINLSLQRNELTSNDIMWSIHEYAKPYELTKNEAYILFNILRDFLKEKKGKMQDKFLDPSIAPERRWFSNYSNDIKFNALVYALELGYYNEKYTEIFKEITSILSVKVQENAIAVKDIKEGKEISLNLISWINDNKTYINKDYKYIREAACHLFVIWSKDHPNRFPKEFGEMATILLQKEYITCADYANVSKYFKI
jgi:hypothetical protein